MAQTKKTNNSFLVDKVKLRIDHIPDAPVVLDCFGGEGKIWEEVSRITGKNVSRIGIDKVNYGVGFYLDGDNMAYLKNIDLTKYNVVDLDAYGVPYKQLKVLFSRKYIGHVFVTFIQSVYGCIPFGLLCDIGFSKNMTSACPSLFAERGWQYFTEYLAINGVNQIYHRSHERKHYLYFPCTS